MRLKARIGTKIVCAFVVMAAMIAALGAYGIYVLSAAGDIVADTYDRPLMAINFARAANQDFTEMQLHLARPGAAAAAPPEADRALATLEKAFFDDLAVAYDRTGGDEQRGLIVRIRERVQSWDAVRRGESASAAGLGLDALSQAIAADFDRLIEVTADDAFVERRKGVTAIAAFENWSIAAAAAALVFAVLIALLLSRRILRPLSAAASVADRIAGGELDTPIPEGGEDETGILLRSMAVMRDNVRAMMEREQAQRRSAQQRLYDALESSREGMVLVDAQGRVAIANSQAAVFFPSLAARLVEGADFDATFAELGVQLQDGELRLADGRWLRVSRSTTQDGGFFLFLSDFSEVKARERRLLEAQEQAEAASRAKSSFLANMSHELRTPLNAIIGFSEIMAGEMFGALGNRRYSQYSGDIVNSGRHLLAIINSVLDLAKNEAGKLEIDAQSVDLAEVLADCVTMIREQCARGGLTLEVSEPQAPILLMGDAQKLRQVFLNLLSNATKFTEPGGRVTVAVSCATEGEVTVLVADTGIGMSPDDIPVALAPFGQVDSRLARKFEGTGLGLPLAKAFVELHKGKLVIASAPGRGTTVTVALPLATPQIAPQPFRLRAAG